MKPLLRNHYLLALFTVIALAVVAGAFILFTSSTQKQQRRVIEVRDRLASFEQNRKVFSEEAKELGAIDEKITTLEEYVLSTQTIPSFLSSLEEKAKKHGIDFTITGVQNEEKEDSAKKLHVDFSATGSFSSLEAFSNEILSQPYLLTFTRFSLYAGGSEGRNSIQNAEWQLLGGVDVISF